MLSGDLPLFYRLNDKKYLVGVMDGMGHGVRGGVTVCLAKRFLDRLVSKGVHDPKTIAEELNESLTSLFTDIRYAVTLVSLIDDKKALITNAGNEGTWVYDPISQQVSEVEPFGYSIGMFSKEDLSRMGKTFDYRDDERTISQGFTLISCTDGIYERVGFEFEAVKHIIRSNVGDIDRVITETFGYAKALPPKSPDDHTVVGVCLTAPATLI